MKRKLNRATIVVALFAAGFLSACAQPRIAVNPSVWNSKEARMGVAIVKHPKAAAHKAGAQGLLDMAINSAMASDLKAHLLTLNPNEFDTIKDRFAVELQKRGLQANVILSPVDLDAYEKVVRPEGETGDYFDKDLKVLANKESIDLLILLSIDGFGTIRQYYGFIPLGSPGGYCRVSGRLIDLRSNQLLWRTSSAENESTVAVDGSWDQPPSYPGLTEAVKKAMASSQEFLIKDFFGEGQLAASK